MREYVTEAIVLKKEPLREFDARVSLYTKDEGKVSAVVTSARKILSKLSPHLEPLSLAEVRLTEKGGAHLTDALRRRLLPKTAFSSLSVINALVLPGERDHALWSFMTAGEASVRGVLSLLGFDPSFARCEACGEAPACFVFRDALYFCGRCTPPTLSLEEHVRLD